MANRVCLQSLPQRLVVLPAPWTCRETMGFYYSKDHAMTDPRNVAHDKKLQQEKKHRDEEIAPGSDKTPQPGKKTPMGHHASDTAKVPDKAEPVPSEEKPLY